MTDFLDLFTPAELDELAELDDSELARIFDDLDLAEQRAISDALVVHEAKTDPLAHLTWEEWNKAVAPTHFTRDYADHHREFWEWVDRIGPARPKPYLAIWPRGHTKSTCAEVAVIRLGAQGTRSYCLYVSHTQEQADDHVSTIGAILESDAMARHYPAMSEVKVNKFGSSRGWRRNRLRTASGFTVDALGLDASRRGAKLDEVRPDMMVLDDIDDQHASSKVTTKNMRTITSALIPALQPNKVIIMAQNLVAPNSIAAQISDGRADMLGGAIRSGPFPAVVDMEHERRDGEWVITAGRPTWSGMDLAECSAQMTDMGLWSFTIECQQDTHERPGAIWRKEDIHHWDGELPAFDRVVVGVDPNQTGRSDDAGVVVVARAKMADGFYHAFVLFDASKLEAPSQWRESLGRAVIKHKVGTAVVEDAGLGEHAKLTVKGASWFKDYPVAFSFPSVRLGKADRARPVWALYAEGRVHHAQVFPYLEAQLTGWEPDTDPVSPGALDAMVHAVTHLLIGKKGPPNVARGA